MVSRLFGPGFLGVKREIAVLKTINSFGCPCGFVPGKTESGELSFHSVKRLIRDLGKSAKIKTTVGKTATAHDFRRSFASRWAMKVMPQVLQQLMRHADIKTVLTQTKRDFMC